jgi:hypothetical protein
MKLKSEVLNGMVLKLLCGNKILPQRNHCFRSAWNSWFQSEVIWKIKALDPEIQTVYIKPPPQNEVLKALLSMPISVFNTEIYLTSDEAETK